MMDEGGRGETLSMTAFSLLARATPGVSNNVGDLLELYDQFRPSLFSYLRSLNHQPDEAEDIIQEVFLRLHGALWQGVKVRNPRGWVFRVAHNLSVGKHRDSNRLVTDCSELLELIVNRLPNPQLNPEEHALHKERFGRVARVFAGLTERQRQCVHLRAEGLTYREIAEVLGLSTQRVCEIIQRALCKLAGEE